MTQKKRKTLDKKIISNFPSSHNFLTAQLNEKTANLNNSSSGNSNQPVIRKGSPLPLALPREKRDVSRSKLRGEKLVAFPRQQKFQFLPRPAIILILKPRSCILRLVEFPERDRGSERGAENPNKRKPLFALVGAVFLIFIFFSRAPKGNRFSRSSFSNGARTRIVKGPVPKGRGSRKGKKKLVLSLSAARFFLARQQVRKEKYPIFTAALPAKGQRREGVADFQGQNWKEEKPPAQFV